MCVHTFLLKRIAWNLRLWHVNHAMYVKGNVLAVRRPVLVAETVYVFAIKTSVERVIAG